MIPATDYQAIVVRPSLDAFYASNGDLRLAMHAAIALTHAIDYAFQNRGPDPRTAAAAAEDYRRDLVERCFSFRVVEGFATASKHGTMSRRDLSGFSSSGHGTFPPAFLGSSTFGHSFFGDAIGGVCVRWPDQGWVNLTRALQVSRSMLETELPELTVVPEPPPAANAP